jgi:transposase
VVSGLDHRRDLGPGARPAARPGADRRRARPATLGRGAGLPVGQKSSEGGEQIGYDAGKRVRGRKRHLLVDTLGLLLHVVVHSASVQDRAGAKLVLTGAKRRFPLLGLVWVDGGYVNSVDAGLVGWAARTEGIEIVAVPRNADVKGFQVLPRRWVVERTLCAARRLVVSPAQPGGTRREVSGSNG